MNKNQALESVKAFYPADKEIKEIFLGLNLEPINGWRKWANCKSGYLEIKDNKEIKIQSKTKIISEDLNDLYSHTSLKELIEVSKILLYSFSKKYEDFLFLGNDKKIRFRSKSFNDKDIKCLNPLMFGNFDLLKELIKNKNIKGYKTISKKIIITSLPYDKEFVEKTNCDILKELL